MTSTKDILFVLPKTATPGLSNIMAKGSNPEKKSISVWILSKGGGVWGLVLPEFKLFEAQGQHNRIIG